MLRAIATVAILGNLAHAGTLGVGDPATELDVAVDAAGKPIKLARYRGVWLVIASGASWCKPCKEELPGIDVLAGQYAGRATFVALDLDDEVPDGKAFHATIGLAHMLRIYLSPAISAMSDRYGGAGLPVTFVIDPRGVVRFVQQGFDNKIGTTKLQAALAKLLPPKKPPPDQPRPPRPPTKPAVTPIPMWIIPDQPHVILWADGWSLPF